MAGPTVPTTAAANAAVGRNPKAPEVIATVSPQGAMVG